MDNLELISKNAALQICRGYAVDTNPSHHDLNTRGGYGNWMHHNGEACASMSIQTKIEKLPVVDAEPVEHGLWIRQKGSAHVFKCSACGFVFAGAAIAKYCPNCGAKMDGRETDE